MTVTVDWDSDWKVLERLLPPDWRASAARFGIATVGPTTRGTKVDDPGVVLRAVLHHVCAGVALRVTAALVYGLLGVDVSAVALHKWMCKVGPWLAALRAGLQRTADTFARDGWAGYDVIAADGTTVARPGAKGASARIHVAVRLADLQPVARRPTTAKVGETLRRFVLRAGQLWILDRGYSNPPGVAYAASNAAAVLMRVNPRSLPLFDRRGRPIAVQGRLDGTLRRAGQRAEWVVQVHPADAEPIVGRLIAVRLSPSQHAKARARLEREYGKGKVPAEALRLARYVGLFTTVPADRLTAAQLVTLYRARWQVELAIKRDKSICGLDELPNFRDDTIEAWLHAKLLGIELARRLSTASVPFPPSVVGVYALAPRPAAVADPARRA
jgi:hypothetical protein